MNKMTLTDKVDIATSLLNVTLAPILMIGCVVAFSRGGGIEFGIWSLFFGLFWIAGYGGGLFLPFGDVTNGRQTYGGGRYLYDTIKGADLGATLDEMVLDFNYAYHPSCHYNPRWVCPLAPPESKLPFPILAGEKSWLS